MIPPVMFLFHTITLAIHCLFKKFCNSHMSVDTYKGQKRTSEMLAAGIPGGWDLLDMCAGNQILVLQKSSTCS